MRIIQKARAPLDSKQYRLRSARESDFTELIDEPVQIWDGDKLLVVYDQADRNPEWARELDRTFAALQRVEYRTSYRTSGLKHTSQTVGYLPRITIRRDFCTSTATARRQPREHAAVIAASRIVTAIYRENNPDLFKIHQADAERVLPQYRIEGGPFTSGIINENNPLKYHHDAGNFVNRWSGMLVFKRHIDGGYLALPELDMGLACRHNTIVLFDGQSIMHGVTPITRTRADAKRYSIVYYSLRGMWSCEPVGSEVERIRRKRTEQEQRRSQSSSSRGNDGRTTNEVHA